MTEYTNITGSLRDTPDGETYTFSVKKFKKWKKAFLERYKEIHGTSFGIDVPQSKDRETIYRRLFNMGNIDIFGTGNHGTFVGELLLAKAWEVQNIFNK